MQDGDHAERIAGTQPARRPAVAVDVKVAVEDHQPAQARRAVARRAVPRCGQEWILPSVREAALATTFGIGWKSSAGPKRWPTDETA